METMHGMEDHGGFVSAIAESVRLLQEITWPLGTREAVGVFIRKHPRSMPPFMVMRFLVMNLLSIVLGTA